VKKTKRALVLALGIIPMLLIGMAPPSLAATHAEYLLTSPYTGVAAQPGTTLKLNLTAYAPSTESVNLNVTKAPKGWDTVLRGGGYVVSSVTANPDNGTKLQFSIDVPPDAKAGSYDFVISENGSAGSSKLKLTIDVSAVVDNGIGITADFPSLTGQPSDTFTYTLTVDNNTPSQQSFNFDPQAPQGWSVTASPVKEQRAASLSIDAGASAKIKVKANPPVGAAEGSYDIPVNVTASNGASGSFTLTAVVKGTGKLGMSTASGVLNTKGHANKESTEVILLANSGSASLRDVKLAATAPKDWKVTFEPSTVGELTPGSTTQVVATIKPAKGAVVGDYMITMRASAGHASKTMDLRYRVTTSSVLGWLGIVVIVAAVGSVMTMFWRFGRR